MLTANKIIEGHTPDDQLRSEGPISPLPAPEVHNCPHDWETNRGSVHLRRYLRDWCIGRLTRYSRTRLEH
jgi:hypothetical protein